MSETVLSVENVSVKYRLTEQKVDDLKDYIIKLFKRELRYKDFFALQEVSFSLEKIFFSFCMRIFLKAMCTGARVILSSTVLLLKRLNC